MSLLKFVAIIILVLLGMVIANTLDEKQNKENACGNYCTVR